MFLLVLDLEPFFGVKSPLSRSPQSLCLPFGLYTFPPPLGPLHSILFTRIPPTGSCSLTTACHSVVLWSSDVSDEPHRGMIRYT